MAIVSTRFVLVLCVCICLFYVAETLFLAPQYTSKSPFTYDTKNKEVNYLLKVCDIAALDLCNLTVEISLPYDSWSIFDGTYVNITVLGSGDNCKHVLCRNDPSSVINPNVCTFTFKREMGNKIYVTTKGGPSAEFSSVFTSNFTCPDNRIIPNDLPFISPDLEDCRILTESTRIITETVEPLHVLTSKSTFDALQIQLSSCMSTNPNNTVLTIVATDDQSAFATYLCEIYPCNTAIAVAYDNSGTGYNYVRPKVVLLPRLTLAIYGWGAYKGINSFLLQFVEGLDHKDNFVKRAIDKFHR